MNEDEKEKIRMCISILEENWKEEFKEGMKVGDLRMVASNYKGEERDALLCQHTWFPEGCGDEVEKMKVIWFEKKLEDIHVDWDDEPEAYGEGVLKEGKDTYEECDAEKLKEMCMYGSYVEEIRKEEMICIEDRIWNPDDCNDDKKKVIWKTNAA